MPIEIHPTEDPVANFLESKGHSRLLDVIDQLRSQGVNRYVSLPQIIVCGDQSSGKSSVLNAVSGEEFPAKDTLCTRFATELILRRAPNVDIKVSLSPGNDRTEAEKQKLVKFRYSNASLHSLPDIVEKAKISMGLDSNSKAFTNDVLRIELSGPTQPDLTLVDLPGVIHSQNKTQTADDVQLIAKLVKAYMAKSRSIILAVVSAKYDYSNQVITEMARKVDLVGQRTLGIITKPDTLQKGSNDEKSYVELAKNEAVTLRLGWHVLRNRGWKEQNYSMKERDDTERDFLAQGVWARLPNTSRGAAALKVRLSSLLRDQIISELPNLIKDVEAGIEECNHRLVILGHSRATVDEQRFYLVNISESFSRLINSAVDGAYQDDFFGKADTDLGFSKRLRAVVQDHLGDFSHELHCIGHAVYIVDDDDDHDYDEDYDILGFKSTRPRFVRRSQHLQDVHWLRQGTRGKELSGLFNPGLVDDLFFAQSKPWRAIVETYQAIILDSVTQCVDSILDHVADESTREGLEMHILGPKKEQFTEKLHEKVDELLRPHEQGHPITYNHYFTNNIMDARQSRKKKATEAKLKSYRNLTASGKHAAALSEEEEQRLVNTLVEENPGDMDLWACSEAVDAMEAYYKVASKMLIDNFAQLAIEWCVMQNLRTLFNPAVVLRMPDDLIKEIAGEPVYSQNERHAAQTKLESLRQGLETLRILNRRKTQGFETQKENLPGSAMAIELDETRDDGAESPAPGKLREWPPEESSGVNTPCDASSLLSPLIATPGSPTPEGTLVPTESLQSREPRDVGSSYKEPDVQTDRSIGTSYDSWGNPKSQDKATKTSDITTNRWKKPKSKKKAPRPVALAERTRQPTSQGWNANDWGNLGKFPDGW